MKTISGLKTNLSIIFFLFTALAADSQTAIPGGTVSGVWTLAGSPYLVHGSILIPADSTLTIDPGVTINFQGHYKFLVLGRLLAIGTATDTIYFTAANTTTGWYGFRFDNTPATNDSSKIYYCNIQWGKANGGGNDAYGGAFFINNFSKINIANCLIKNNSASSGGGICCFHSPCNIYDNVISNNSSDFGGGVYGETSNMLITHNEISNNSVTNAGGGIYTRNNSCPTISYNTISSNSALSAAGGILCANDSGYTEIIHNLITYNTASSYKAGGIYLDGSNARVVNNTLAYNTSGGWGGAMNCFNGRKSTYITGNVISNNSALGGGGLAISSNDSSTLISNNTITNNSSTYPSGSGIDCYNSKLELTNNTIANNTTAGPGGGVYFSLGSYAVFRNCILYGNTTNTGETEVYLYDESSDPDFYFCNVKGGSAGFDLNGNFYTGTYQNNMDLNPLFVSPSAGSGTGSNGLTADWSLQSASPCINAGDPAGIYPSIDIAGNPRIVGTLIDIGAYEYQGPVGFSDFAVPGRSLAHPNPFNAYSIIELLGAGKEFQLKIYNPLGELIRTFQGIAGSHFRFERNGLPTGIYYIRLVQNNRIIAADKLIITD